MAAAGIGDPAIRKTLVLLQSILKRAVEWRRLDSNPARAVRKPGQRRTRVVRPLPPDTIEAMRAHLLQHDQQIDATMVAVLAYGGLRPGEALGLRWHDVRDRTVLVERSVAFGQLKQTKTGQTRTVRLLSPLADTLAAWRETSDRSTPTDLVFPSPDGSPWNHDRAANWRKRTFAEAAAAAGVEKARPYDLRHSFISLLIAQGATVVEVARKAGHSPTMALSTYAHLFDEFAEAPRTSAEDVILAARTKAGTHEVSVLGPRPADLSTPGAQNPWKQGVGDPGLEPGTSSLSGKPFVPSSPPNSHLNPANRSDRGGGRGLEGTGRYKLVAPSWPHGRASRADCRMTRKRTSRRRYGQARTLRRRAAARLHDRFQGGKPRHVALVDHAAVGVHDGVAMARVRASPQPLPCRLNNVACLPTSTSAGLASNRRR